MQGKTPRLKRVEGEQVMTVLQDSSTQVDARLLQCTQRMARDGHLGKEGGGEGIEVAISKESTDTETNKSGLWKVTDDYECYSRIHRERSIGTSNSKGIHNETLCRRERGEM